MQLMFVVTVHFQVDITFWSRSFKSSKYERETGSRKTIYVCRAGCPARIYAQNSDAVLVGVAISFQLERLFVYGFDR